MGQMGLNPGGASFVRSFSDLQNQRPPNPLNDSWQPDNPSSGGGTFLEPYTINRDGSEVDVPTYGRKTDLDPLILNVEAGYGNPNIDYSHGTFPYGQKSELEYMQRNFDTNSDLMLEWVDRYMRVGMSNDIASLFAIRHLTNDWENEPTLQTVQLTQKLYTRHTQIEDDDRELTLDEICVRETPAFISTDCLLRWVDRYLAIGFHPEPAVMLVVRHLRNDWQQFTESDTENIRQELINMYQSYSGDQTTAFT